MPIVWPSCQAGAQRSRGYHQRAGQVMIRCSTMGEVSTKRRSARIDRRDLLQTVERWNLSERGWKEVEEHRGTTMMEGRGGRNGEQISGVGAGIRSGQCKGTCRPDIRCFLAGGTRHSPSASQHARSTCALRHCDRDRHIVSRHQPIMSSNPQSGASVPPTIVAPAPEKRPVGKMSRLPTLEALARRCAWAILGTRARLMLSNIQNKSWGVYGCR